MSRDLEVQSHKVIVCIIYRELWMPDKNSLNLENLYITIQSSRK